MSINEELADFLSKEVGDSDERIGISTYLDTGVPELNFALTGHYERGLPGGRMIEIFGPPSCGKTFLATMAMAAAQKMGGIAAFSDHERSFEPELAKTLGLSLDRDKFIYKRPQTFEESIHLAMTFCEKIRNAKMIPESAPLIWVFDSLASMVPHEKLFNDKGERRDPKEVNMRLKLALATATSQNFPALAQFAEDYNMTAVFLNQLRITPGVTHGDPNTTPGGAAPEFYASQRISLGRGEITNGKKGKDKVILGFEVRAKVTKNKVARPYRTAKWQVLFNKGAGVTLDPISTNLDFLARAGLVEKAGNRIVWEGKKLYQSVLAQELKSDPEALAKLKALLPKGEEELEVTMESEYGDGIEVA